MHSFLLTGAVFAAIAYATPTPLQKRNFCDRIGVEPETYHTYGTDDCPPKLRVDKMGTCPVEFHRFEDEQFCAAFCEQTTEYKWGREVIFLANPYCHGPMSCSISDTVTVAFSLTFSSSLSAKFTDTLTAGISGGMSKTNSEAHAQTKSVSLKERECGYFTFIPMIKHTCGAWSEGGVRSDLFIPICDQDKVGTKKVCAEQPTSRPGFGDEPSGVTIFVRVDCDTQKPLPADRQDPTYNHEGVPLKREEYEAYADFFNPPEPEPEYQDKKECKGKEEEYFWRDNARDHVDEFCDDAVGKYDPGIAGNIERSFEEGTAEEQIWSFEWTSKGNNDEQTVLDKCKAAMADLIDSCDTNSHEWKHGGTFVWATDPDSPDAEYTFNIRAKRERNLPIGTRVGKCDVWYQFWGGYDEFYISGGGFAGADYGQDLLLGNLRRCGVVSEWTFSYYDTIQDDGTEWNAYGRIPIGAQQWDCVRSAMVDSGSQGDIGCGGR